VVSKNRTLYLKLSDCYGRCWIADTTDFSCSAFGKLCSRPCILKANLTWSTTWVKFCQLIASLCFGFTPILSDKTQTWVSEVYL